MNKLLTDKVWVRLNAHGKASISGLMDRPEMKDCKKQDGWYEFRIDLLMSRFGHVVDMGEVFVDNKIYFDKPL